MNGRKNDSRESSQADKFRDAARELETDESDENFDRMVKKIAKPAPHPVEKGRKPD